MKMPTTTNWKLYPTLMQIMTTKAQQNLWPLPIKFNNNHITAPQLNRILGTLCFYMEGVVLVDFTGWVQCNKHKVQIPLQSRRGAAGELCDLRRSLSMPPSIQL